MTTFTIQRSKWDRGRCGAAVLYPHPYVSLLCRKTGKMCCLGFVAIQLGLTEKDIRNEAEPDERNERHAKVLDGVLLVKENDCVAQTELTKRAIKINDHDKLSEPEREKKLSILFELHGHKLVFED